MLGVGTDIPFILSGNLPVAGITAGEEVGINVLDLLLHKRADAVCPTTCPRRLTFGSYLPFALSLSPKESCEVMQATLCPKWPN